MFITLLPRSLLPTFANQPRVSDSISLHWSTSQNNLAQALVRGGKLEDAARYFARALFTQRKIVQSRVDAEGRHVESQAAVAALATTLNNLGLLLTQTEANTEAERSYIEAVGLLTEDGIKPDMPSQQQLAAVYTNLSGLLTRTSPERAVEYARQALDGQLDALEAQPSNVKLATQTIVTLNTLGGVLNNVGFLCQQLGDQQAATDAYQEAVEHQSIAVRLALEVKRYRQYLRKHQENYETVATASSNSSREGS